MDLLEKTIIELTRKGDQEKLRVLKKLDQLILPSQRKRIAQNDKSVLAELMLPKWLSWDLLYTWACKKELKGNVCVFCNKPAEGINFKGKHVCWECVSEIKVLNRKD